MKDQVSCPIDGVSIDDTKVRLGAGIVLLLAVIYLVTWHWVIFAFLTIDFTLRTFNKANYSLISALSRFISETFNFKIKPVDRGPKRFAAGIGATFSALILAATLLGFYTPASIFAGTLILFAALESIVGFCAGCYVYSLLQIFQKR